VTAYEAVGSVSWPVFIGVTVIIFGWLGLMAATALVRMWRPWWANIVYGLILGLADRLFETMLFDGSLLHWGAYVVDTIYIIAVMLISYRLALTRRMIAQYPWLYERAGLFQWREKVTG
jgi:branched-chain amino acid transport system ATP-binding protein